MVDGVGQSSNKVVMNASNGFGNSLDGARKKAANKSNSTEKQMTLDELSMSIPLCGAPPAEVSGTPKGTTSQLAKKKKKPKSKLLSKLKDSLVYCLKKVMRWIEDRKKKKQRNKQHDAKRDKD